MEQGFQGPVPESWVSIKESIAWSRLGRPQVMLEETSESGIYIPGQCGISRLRKGYRLEIGE